MNGQDKPLNQGEPSPSPLGASGFGGQENIPSASAWNPAAIPTPETQSASPTPAPAPMTEQPLVSPSETSAPEYVSPASAPVSEPVSPPVAPSFTPGSGPQPFSAPSFATTPPATPVTEPITPTPAPIPTEPIPQSPTPSVPIPPFIAEGGLSTPTPIPAPLGTAPEQFPTISPRTFEVPAEPVAPREPQSFAPLSQAAPVPPPPSVASTIDLRTMASDVSSLQSTGGAEAVPQSFSPDALASESGAVFSPTEAAAMEAEKPKSKTGKIFLIVGVAILVFAAGIGAYLMLSGRSSAPAPSESVTEALPAEAPPVEALPPAEESPAVPQAAPSRPHSSFFVNAADSVEQKVIPETTPEEIKRAFYSLEEGATTPADGFLKEIVLTRSGTGFVNFSEFLGAMLPELNQDSVKTLFNEDFTGFVYQDRANAMMGFIASVKPGSSPEVITSFSSSIEASPNIGNFYSRNPGNPAASWQGGFVSGKDVRYLAFPSVGYAFDYGWFTDDNGITYLVISASYAGMREAVSRAGL